MAQKSEYRCVPEKVTQCNQSLWKVASASAGDVVHRSSECECKCKEVSLITSIRRGYMVYVLFSRAPTSTSSHPHSGHDRHDNTHD